MPLSDLSLDELERYRPTIAQPADFDEFWATTLAESRAVAHPPVIESVDAHLPLVDVSDVSFSGYGGDPIKAWMLRPVGLDGPLPAVVTFRGYGGGRGVPVEHLAWAAAGYVHVVMDTRGQGSGWSAGTTPDPHGTGPAFPGVMTRGIENPADYYYRRLYTDAALLVDVVAGLPGVDGARVIVAGESQGGGVAIAAAGLARIPVAALIDVPFLCHFERAMDIASAGPYLELASYLGTHHSSAEVVHHTLSYFDGVNLAKRMTAAASFSAALMDTICPPSTVFAAFHAAGSGVKAIAVYRYNGHEGGRPNQWGVHERFLRERVPHTS